MIDHLLPFIEDIAQRAAALADTHRTESAELGLVVIQCRQLFDAGHFLEADEILSQVKQRIDFLTI